MEGHTFRSIENAEEIKRRKLFGTRFMESSFAICFHSYKCPISYWLYPIVCVVVDDQLLTFSWNLCFVLPILWNVITSVSKNRWLYKARFKDVFGKNWSLNFIFVYRNFFTIYII